MKVDLWKWAFYILAVLWLILGLWIGYGYYVRYRAFSEVYRYKQELDGLIEKHDKINQKIDDYIRILEENKKKLEGK